MDFSLSVLLSISEQSFCADAINYCDRGVSDELQRNGIRESDGLNS